VVRWWRGALTAGDNGGRVTRAGQAVLWKEEKEV
jgi:hypothetical protein